MDESDPNGFIIRTNKSGKMAAVMPDKSYTLLAHSPEEAKDWFGVLSASSTQYQVTHLIDTTRPTFSSIQQNRNLPPLPASTLPIIDNENAHDQPESSAQAQNSAGSETHDGAEVVPTTYQIEEGRGSLDATTSAPHPQDSSQVASYEYGGGEVTTTEPQNLSSFPDGDVDLYSAPEEMNQKQATQDSATPLHEQSEHEVSSSGIQNTTTTNENATSIGDATNAQTTSEIQNATSIGDTAANAQTTSGIQNASNLQTDSETVPTLPTHSASKGLDLDNAVSSPETDTPVQNISSNIQNKSALVTDEYADPTLSSEALTESTHQNLPSETQADELQYHKPLPSHKTYDANLNEQHDPSNVPLRGEDELQYRDPPTHVDPNNATHVA
jgi:hypothetical protein